ADPGYVLIAVPLSKSLLEPISVQHFQAVSAYTPRESGQILDRWVGKINNSIFTGVSRIDLRTPDHPGQFEVELQDGQTFQPHTFQISWVKVLSGSAHWMGLATCPVEADGDWHVLSDRIFLKATQPLRLVVFQGPYGEVGPLHLAG